MERGVAQNDYETGSQKTFKINGLHLFVWFREGFCRRDSYISHRTNFLWKSFLRRP